MKLIWKLKIRYSIWFRITIPWRYPKLVKIWGLCKSKLFHFNLALSFYWPYWAETKITVTKSLWFVSGIFLEPNIIINQLLGVLSFNIWNEIGPLICYMTKLNRVKLRQSEKAPQIWNKCLPIIWHLHSNVKNGRFFKILWPSLIIWTLRSLF